MSEEELRNLGGTLETDSPETEAKNDEDALIAAYTGEPEELTQAISADSTLYGIRGLVDMRSRIPRQNTGGATERHSLSRKTGGVTIHYAGPAQNRNISAWDRLASYARYHMRANAFGPGAHGDTIQYHIGIAEDGTKYLLNDLEKARWHAGHYNSNQFALAINFPIGEGQAPTEAQLRSGREVADDWLKARGQGRSQVRGHKEVGASGCPGSLLMNGLVYPMRQGKNPGGGSTPTPAPKPGDGLTRLYLAEDYEKGRQVGAFSTESGIKSFEETLKSAGLKTYRGK